MKSLLKACNARHIDRLPSTEALAAIDRLPDASLKVMAEEFLQMSVDAPHDHSTFPPKLLEKIVEIQVTTSHRLFYDMKDMQPTLKTRYTSLQTFNRARRPNNLQRKIKDTSDRGLKVANSTIHRTNDELCINVDTGRVSPLTKRGSFNSEPTKNVAVSDVEPKKWQTTKADRVTRVKIRNSRRRIMEVPAPIPEAANENVDAQAQGDASESPDTASSHESSPMVAHKKTRIDNIMRLPPDIPTVLTYISKFVESSNTVAFLIHFCSFQAYEENA